MSDFDCLDQAWAGLTQSDAGCYQIGPFVVRIDATSDAFARRLTRAFSHLRMGNASPHLTIRLWDNAKLPPLHWKQIHSNGYRGYAELPFYFHYFETIGALSAVDVERNLAYYIIRDVDAIPWWVDGSPLQVILHVWLREQGMQLTHSGSIVNGENALLLAGKGGSGKSTTVLSSLREGLSTLGEDYILLSKNRAYSVYESAKWQPHTRTLLPSYESQITNPDVADQEKALVYYSDLFPAQLPHSACIRAVVSLTVGNRTELQKADLRTSLQSLCLSTVMQLPHTDPRTLSILQEALAPLAHYRLVLGPDLRANVALLRELLS